ncbi:MAG: GNAT family N-acetyltransferase [Chloroflexi bacterium]|nr:GNAT family N-acetyltransferase [Chloroflexota bacterium]
MTVLPSTATIQDHLDDFDSLEADWHRVLASSPARHIFFTPCWGRSWWQNLGAGELHLLSVRHGGAVVGIVPLVRQGDTLRLLGDKEVCDYLDIIAAVGAGDIVAGALIRFASNGGCSLDLHPLLPDSTASLNVVPLARELGCVTHTEPLDVSYGMPLPSSWDEYLESLHGKDRHELKRKLRRLERAGQVRFYASHSLSEDLEDFLRLFRISRASKDEFLTPRREAFFRQLYQATGERGWLRLYFMELDGRRVAAAFCFNFNGTLYLYNSGFEPAYQGLSVGLLCKVLSIQTAISEGERAYDFLRGAEDYKAHLGGKPTPVYRCTIVTQPGKSSVPEVVRQ